MKTGGLGDRWLVGGYDISGDIQALNGIGGGPAAGDVTDITQEAHARLGLLRDGTMGAVTYFDAANAHPVLSALPAADTLMTYLRGTTLGNPSACLNAKQIGYDGTRGNDGALTLTTKGDGNGFGLEWGIQLTPGVRSDSTATDGASIDTAADAAFGAQAYLQVTGFTGTSVTIAIEDSEDNSTWTAVTGLTFDAATAAPAWQRLAIVNTATVRRYVRASSSGTFTAASFAVVLVKNQVAGVSF